MTGLVQEENMSLKQVSKSLPHSQIFNDNRAVKHFINEYTNCSIYIALLTDVRIIPLHLFFSSWSNVFDRAASKSRFNPFTGRLCMVTIETPMWEKKLQKLVTEFVKVKQMFSSI